MPTSWTTPITWATNQLVTAADLNTQVRDNMTYLFSDRPAAGVQRTAGADYTTTSTSFVDMDATNLALTLNIASGRARIGFSGVFFSDISGGRLLHFDVAVDGTRLTGASTSGALQAVITNLNTIVSGTFFKTGLSVGSHTFKLQWRIDLGTATCQVVAAPLWFWVEEY